MTLTVGSLFSGIGGLDLGLERAGMTVRWQSEIDPYCCRVLAKHWPDVPNLGDVTTIDWSTVEHVDLICGGYPCPAFSQAARGRNVAPDLWPWMRDAIAALRPRFVLIENVAAHLGRGFPAVLADLDALGFDAEWTTLTACAFGAPHTRRRLFAVAYPHGSSQPVFPVDAQVAGVPALPGDRRHWGLPTADDVGTDDGLPTTLDGVVVENAHEICYQEGRAARLPGLDQVRVMWDDGAAPAASSRSRRCVICGDSLPVLSHGSGSEAWKMGARQPTAEGVRNLRAQLHGVQPLTGEELLAGVPSRSWTPKRQQEMARHTDRLRALGNAVVPAVAEWIGRRIMEAA